MNQRKLSARASCNLNPHPVDGSLDVGCLRQGTIMSAE